MEPNTKIGEAGSMLIGVIVAVMVLSIFMFMSLEVPETLLQRDQEEELLFRGRQYVRAIELYMVKHPNLYPRSLEILHVEKCLRRAYKDPMTDHGLWNLVFRLPGKEKMVIAPPDRASDLFARGTLVGVCSSSPELSFKVYRGKKRYSEWAFYIGGKENTEMPELEYAGADAGDGK